MATPGTTPVEGVNYWVPPPPPPMAYQVRYAGLMVRFVASILDMIVLLVATVLVALPFGLLAGASVLSTGAVAPWIGLLWGPLTLLLFGLWIVYFTYFESTTGQTPGKRAMDIRVVDARTGQQIDLGRALLRNILRIVDWFPAFYLIGFVVALVTERKQRIGDLIADTIVVRT